MANRTDSIEVLLRGLPDNSGIYQFFSSENKLIYVGKAKNLKKRVSSYFSKQHDNNKLNVLVKQVTDIRCIVVETEYDALLLENNIIKKIHD